MNAPGKSMLRITSILFIAFGITATLVNLVTLARNLVTGAAFTDSLAIILTISYFSFLIILSLLEPVLGFLGIKKYSDPTQASFFVVTGIILCVLNIVPMVMSFNLLRLIGFVLPIPYIIGGIQNNKAAAAQVA